MSGWGETPPGSQKAQDAGCTCPVSDNHYGEGIPCSVPPDSKCTPRTAYWITRGCPLHDENPKEGE